MGLRDAFTTRQFQDAVQNRNWEQVEKLAAGGADVNSCDGIALRVATQFGKEQTVKTLLENGADPNIMDGAPLMIAAMRGRAKIAEMLVDKGTELCERGPTALRMAELNGHRSTADALRQAMETRGINPDHVCKPPSDAADFIPGKGDNDNDGPPPSCRYSAAARPKF